MRTAELCERQADFLDGLADTEKEAFRRDAYRQMAAFWRASAKLKAAIPTPGAADWRRLAEAEPPLVNLWRQRLPKDDETDLTR